MTIAAGTRLGRYEIRSKIGEGGMGEVYLAYDTDLDRSVAIKFLPAELAADQRRMQRFVQEAKAASALNHPNILTIYEIAQTNEARFFVSEFVEGVTLREHMARRPVVKETNNVSNIWSLPLDGGKSQQLTDWKTDRIFWFTWSRDSKQLAVSRGRTSFDVVLIKDFK